MDKKQYIYTDSSSVEHNIEISKSDFTLAQKDKSIHDQKFLTKPTTFFKDALRRFRKNKSSVAGAIILGILLCLSIIVPLAVTYDIIKPHPTETLLSPKLFPSGTGFYDGTSRKENVPVDPNRPIEGKEGYYYPFEDSYPARAVSNLSKAKAGYVNSYSSSVKAGYVSFINENGTYKAPSDENEEDTNSKKFAPATLTSKTSFTYDADKKYNLDLVLLDDDISNELLETTPKKVETDTSDEENKDEENKDQNNSDSIVKYTKAKYGIYLSFNVTDPDYSSYNFEYIIKDQSANDSDYDITSEKFEETEGEYSLGTSTLKTLKLTDFTSGLKDFETEITVKDGDEIKKETIKPYDLGIGKIKVNISIYPEINNYSYLTIRSLTLKEDGADNSTLDKISFANGTTFMARTSDDVGYFSFYGRKTLFHGIGLVADFTFDSYAVPYGVQTKVLYKQDFQTYIDNGWVKIKDESKTLEETLDEAYFEVDNGILEKYFDVLNPNRFPVIEIVQVIPSDFDEVKAYSITCNVSGYKYLGYETMPVYLMGTDYQGKDLLKKTFVGLRNSLGLGILTFVVCFTIGLIWGAVSGYYGGTTDIVMQRFTDILSGVPWIVIMTLCILHLGSNFGTFILALCLTGWIGTASLTRTQFYRFRDREYTLASRTLGARNSRLIFRHILPNAMGTIITSSVLMIPSVIFSEATISYLGLGFQSMESLGVTLSKNQGYLSTYPYLILFPSVIMALIMISFNLFGNGLRDAFNPSLKGSE